MRRFNSWKYKGIILLLLAALSLQTLRAGAVPSVGQLNPARGYGVVSMTSDVDAQGRTVCTFTVTNTQPRGGYGIKGLVVYSDYRPIAISAPPRCQTTLYQQRGQYSWWDFNGSADNNPRDGLADSYIAPGETVDDDTFTLTYPAGQTIDPDRFAFGLHVIQPWTGCTFFALAGPAPFARLDLTITASADCVRSGQAITYTYKVCNTGTNLIKSISISDEFGLVASGLSLAPNQCLTKTRTVTLSSCYNSFDNDVNVQGKDATNCACVSTGGTITTHIVHPSLCITKKASDTAITKGQTVTYTYTVKNTGDVTVKNIVVTDDKLGTIGAVGPLAPGASASISSDPIPLTKTTTNIATAEGTDACAGSEVKDTSNCVTVKVVNCSLKLTKTADKECVLSGDTVTYTYTLTNDGDETLYLVSVTDDKLGCVGALLCLSPGATKTWTKKVALTETTTNTATAVGKDLCMCGVVKVVTPPVTVKVVHPKLTLTKTANHTCVLKGQEVTYTYILKNEGDADLTGITLTDDTLGQIAQNVSLAVGDSSPVYTKTTTLNATTTNIATAAGTSVCGFPVTATASVTVDVYDASLKLFAGFTPPCVTENGSSTLSVVVTNPSAYEIDDIVVTVVIGGQTTTLDSGLTLGPGESSAYTLPLDKITADTTAAIHADGLVLGVCPVSDDAQATVHVARPSMTLVKSVDKTLVQSGENGESRVTYTYTLTNTSATPTTINNITITDDQLGSIGTVPSLAPGASVPLTRTVNLRGTVTNEATATGTDGCAGSTVTVKSNPVTVTVLNPAVSLTITHPNPCVPYNATETFTFTVTNTGDTPLSNITVMYQKNQGNAEPVGTIPSLVPGASTTLTLPLQITGTTTVSGIVDGVSTQGSFPANPNNGSPAQVTVCSAITGTVVCSSKGNPIPGATVKLMSGTTKVAEKTTDANGVFKFCGQNDNLESGNYTVEVSATDFITYNSPAPFSYDATGPDTVLPVVVLTPLPITYEAVEQLYGKVYFSDVQSFRNLEKPGSTPLTEGDLYNPAFANPSNTVTYRYVGYIPSFPERGHFGGPGEPEIWVLVNQRLLPENAWNNYSFTNQVGIENGIGTGAGRDRTNSTLTYRFLFSQPFTGPGTAHNLTLTGVTFPGSLITPTIQFLGITWVGGGFAPPSPSSGDVPVGWMVLGRGEFSLPRNVTTTGYVHESFENRCRDIFYRDIHPDMGGDAP